jgi:hypothetical protein
MRTNIFTVGILFLLISCYSFKGISIPSDVNTYSIEPVIDQSYNAPATYPVDFSEAMITKIRKESRLVLNNQNPDIVFRCFVTQFVVNSQAPQPGVTSAINRLNVTIDVEYINKKDEKQNWKSSFNRFQDFDAKENFSTVQQKLITDINLILVDDIFNKAFTNW